MDETTRIVTIVITQLDNMVTSVREWLRNREEATA